MTFADNMKTLLDTLAKLNDELIGSGAMPLSRITIEAFNKGLKEFHRDYFNIPINTPELSEQIKKILVNLNIPEEERTRYLGAKMNVHDFFEELIHFNNIDNQKLKDFNTLIELANRAWWMKVFGSGALAVFLLNAFSPTMIFLRQLSILQQIFAAAAFIPIISLGFTVGVFAYSLYRKLTNDSLTLWQRFRDTFFTFSHTAMKVAGISILIGAAATASPIASGLFIAAEIVNIVGNVVNLARLHREKNKTSFEGLEGLALLQQKARSEAEYKMQRNALIINVVATTIAAGIIAAWCFAPGGLFIGIAAVIAIATIQLAVYYLQKYNKSASKQGLQKTFSKIETDYKNEQALKNQITLGSEAKILHVMGSKLRVSEKVKDSKQVQASSQTKPAVKSLRHPERSEGSPITRHKAISRDPSQARDDVSADQSSQKKFSEIKNQIPGKDKNEGLHSPTIKE